MNNSLNRSITTIIYINDSIIILGLIGNILSFLVFSRKSFAKTSITIYCQSLAIFDSFTLIQLGFDITVLITGVDIVRGTLVGCKLLNYINTSISPMSGWILVFFSIDQLLAVSRLQNFTFFKKRTFQFVLITVTSLFHIAIYVPIPVLMEFYNVTIFYPNNKTEPFVVAKCDMSLGITRTFGVFYIVEANLAPFVIMMTTTSVILKCLYDSRRNLENREQKNGMAMRHKKRDLKFGINSVFLNVLFVLLTTPLVLSLMFPLKNDYVQNEFNQAMCAIFFYLNYSIHFWTHFCVNSIFRHEFLVMARLRPPYEVSTVS
jgi:hypothetical protein